jgi:hypothetical protein
MGNIGWDLFFFPLSNVLVSVIPLQPISYDGALVALSPAFVTGISTLVTCLLSSGALALVVN